MRTFIKLIQPKAAGTAAPAASLGKRLSRDKKGNVLAITAASLPLLVGAMGLGVDFTQWVLWKRTLQGAADSAALAGARTRSFGELDDADVEDEAVKVLNANSTVTRSLTDVNLIASPGQGAGAIPTSVEVIAEAEGKLYFAGLFMNARPTISVRAVAGPRGFGRHCLISLHPTASQAMNIAGNASVDLTCGVISNSNHAQAAYIEGSATLTASNIAAVGGIETNGNGTLNVPTSAQTEGVVAQPDPFGPMGRNLQEPTCAPSAYRAMPTSGTVAAPGCYTINNNYSVSGNLTFSPGVHVIKGPGRFQINSNHTVTGDGVSLVFTDGARLDVSGTPVLTLSAMTTAQAASQTDAARQGLAGVLFWQADASTQPNSITGNAAFTLAGAVYTPHSALNVSGNMGANTQCLQLVASTVEITGSASIPNTCPSDPNWGAFDTMQIVLAE